MQKIKINNESAEHSQSLKYFTEESWELEKDNFPKAVQQQFSGKKKQFYAFIKPVSESGTSSEKTKYLIGLGDKMNVESLQKVSCAFSNSYNKQLIAEPTNLVGLNSESDLQNALIGLYKGTYQYKSKELHPFEELNMQWSVSGFDENVLGLIADRVAAIHEGEKFAMDWLNYPANEKPPKKLVTALQEKGKELDFKIKVLDKKECEKLGLGAYLSVNQASKDTAFTIIEYRHPDAKQHFGWVGKCVLFDTGGISIKPSQNMHYMKSDMGGACAVMGAVISAARLKLPVNITAILPITDNVINQDAYLPGDVVTAYNGKTIEVLNTDAEGRMTLADGLAYLVKNYKVDALMDIATLTGSVVRMFGYSCAGIFNTEVNEFQTYQKSSDACNQKIWSLPLWEEWKEEIESDVADYKNISTKPFGDCIVAATFLKEFTEEHPNWTHMDIAGVAFGNVDYAKDKAATGYGVQLLLNYLDQKLNQTKL